MKTLRYWRTHNGFNEYVDTTTGVVRRVKLASDKQIAYINALRSEIGKKPLESHPEAYKAIKMISKLQEKTNQQKLF